MNTSEDAFSPLGDNLLRTCKQTKLLPQNRQRRITATQSAKREVLANIKEDWTWPPSIDQLGRHFPRKRGSTEWRARESDSSPVASRSPSPSSQNPYRFESPDAVAPSFVSNRAKRRKLVLEEMKWNEGLRAFAERRDFWTGAESEMAIPGVSVKQPERSSTQAIAFIATGQVTDQEDPTYENITETKTLGPSDSDNSTPVSAQSFDASASILSSTLPSTHTGQSSDLLPSPTTLNYSPPTPALTALDDPPPTLVPIAPPLLSPNQHPDLMEITPAVYPTIYSKCVVQGIAPSCPVNLKDVVGCLVQGWKEDGEWPPKSTIQEKGVGGMGKRDSLRQKMRGLRVDGEEVRLERVARRSVGKVKRALRR